MGADKGLLAGDALAERGIQHGDVLVCQLAPRHGQWWLQPSGPARSRCP